MGIRGNGIDRNGQYFHNLCSAKKCYIQSLTHFILRVDCFKLKVYYILQLPRIHVLRVACVQEDIEPVTVVSAYSSQSETGGK